MNTQGITEAASSYGLCRSVSRRLKADWSDFAWQRRPSPSARPAVPGRRVVGLLLLAGVVGFLRTSAETSPGAALEAYKRGNYRAAQSQYGELAKNQPNDPRLRFNAGAAAYRQNDLTNSASWFESVLGSPDLRLQQEAYYNLGNTRFKLGETIEDPQLRQKIWREALTNFSSAIKLNSADSNALSNYAFVQQRLEELQQQQQQQKQSSNDQQKPDNSQQNQDQSKDSDLKSEEQQKSKSEKEEQTSNSGQAAQNQRGQDPADSSNPGDQDGDGQADGQPKDSEKQKEQASGDQSGKESEQKADAPSPESAKQAGEEGAEQSAPAVGKEEKDGEMSAAQAMQLLENQKGEEKALLLRAHGNGREAAERAARIRKPW